MLKDLVKVGVGIGIGVALTLGRETIKRSVHKKFFKKYYGEEANLDKDMEDFENAPDVIIADMTPQEAPVEPEKEPVEDTGRVPGQSKEVKESADEEKRKDK